MPEKEMKINNVENMKVKISVIVSSIAKINQNEVVLEFQIFQMGVFRQETI